MPYFSGFGLVQGYGTPWIGCRKTPPAHGKPWIAGRFVARKTASVELSRGGDAAVLWCRSAGRPARGWGAGRSRRQDKNHIINVQKIFDDTPIQPGSITPACVSIMKTRAALRPGPRLETFPKAALKKIGGDWGGPWESFFTKLLGGVENASPSDGLIGGLKNDARGRQSCGAGRLSGDLGGTCPTSTPLLGTTEDGWLAGRLQPPEAHRDLDAKDEGEPETDPPSRPGRHRGGGLAFTEKVEARCRSVEERAA